MKVFKLYPSNAQVSNVRPPMYLLITSFRNRLIIQISLKEYPKNLHGSLVNLAGVSFTLIVWS